MSLAAIGPGFLPLIGRGVGAILLYAVLGISSAAAALSVAWWPQRFPPASRWLVSSGAMAALSLLFLLPSGIGSTSAVPAPSRRSCTRYARWE